MKRITSLAAAAALALGSLGAAWAQTGGDDPQHADGRNARENGNFSSRGFHNADRAAERTSQANGSTRAQPAQNYDRQGQYRHDNNYGRDNYGHSGYAQRGSAQRDWRSYGYDHRWQRGDRLPAEYRSHSYVVDDWRGHRLSAPPRGYHWVQQGNDYLLVAIATGIIASVLLNQ
jgi:Ni/Co efflux regulator RcnB